MNARTKDNPALDITATAADPGRHRGNLELDGMMAAQLTAAHVALMDCYSRARITKDWPTRQVELNLVIRLSRAFATLLRALERRRGGALDKKSAKQPHARAMADVVEPSWRRAPQGRPAAASATSRASAATTPPPADVCAKSAKQPHAKASAPALASAMTSPSPARAGLQHGSAVAVRRAVMLAETALASKTRGTTPCSQNRRNNPMQCRVPPRDLPL